MGYRPYSPSNPSYLRPEQIDEIKQATNMDWERLKYLLAKGRIAQHTVVSFIMSVCEVQSKNGQRAVNYIQASHVNPRTGKVNELRVRKHMNLTTRRS